MPAQALGALTTTAGTKVAVSSLIPAQQWNAANGPFKGHGIMFQAIEDNSDSVYIYQLQGSTYVAMATLPAPTTNFIPSFSMALTIAPNSIAISDLYLDVGVSGNGALVTILVS